jgi:hypothetical protein
MRDNHRPGRLVRGLRIGLAPLCLMLPGLAVAQSFSAGDLASSRAPSMPATPEGYGEGGIGSLLPNLFDQLGIYAGLNERYTDNATGGAAGAAQSSWITQGMLGVGASRFTPRLNLMLNYGLNVNYFSDSVGNNDNILVNNNLNASATMDVIQNHFLVQAQAYASPIYSSRLGNILPAGQVLPPGANGDIRNSYGYTVQPDFYFKLGDFLRSDLIPSYSAFYFDAQTGGAVTPLGTPVASNQFTKGITERLTSGEFFNRVRWSAIASYSEMGAASSALTQRSATGELSYAIDHGLSVLADVGYQSITSRATLRDTLSSPIYMGGFQFNLARLTGSFRAGEQFHSFSMTGNLVYVLSPRISLFASALDGINTPGAALFNPQAMFGSLQQGFGGGGGLQLPGGIGGIGGFGGLGGVGNPGGVVGLQNSIARFKSQNVGLNYVYEDYNLSVSGFNTSQGTQTATPVGQNPDLRSTGVYVATSKPLAQDIIGSLYTSYRNDTLQVGSADTADLGVTVSYSLYNNTQLYTQGTYFKRFSSAALAGLPGGGGGDVSSFSIIVGITHTFQ